MGNHTILTAGFAQIPKGTTLYEVSPIVGCVLIIDKEHDVICDASFTFVMEKTNEFLASLLLGKSVAQGMKEITPVVSERFLGPGQGAVLQAIRAAVDRYLESKT
ncbi:hypothetical protein T458_09590 [Brevibacillus panacihumi W25]|uniref:DUF3870 domain-containing protein n=2 Tax=Brevibacillus panacihumi TaxID=497735 RepID=V6M8B4_9BACL|nr:DUF3870 domain-containing protein [Brevibacillus panacihumi]EST54779.1 hypothetical protein T458_09590 [Brevibacillus panacihumi W25]RNB85677.1 DUF3870 domain-containing protein [Brevibacillus panacihumi]